MFAKRGAVMFDDLGGDPPNNGSGTVRWTNVDLIRQSAGKALML